MPKSHRQWAGVVAVVVGSAVAIILSGALAGSRSPASHPAGMHVIVVSVDGLRPDAVTALGPDELPNFHRLRNEGAFTDNARSDFTETVTLPNHTDMVTGRPVAGSEGHGLTFNDDSGGVIHGLNPAVPYVASVFDVVHDRSGSTAMYVSKPKFDLLNRSWDGANGAADVIGEDNGQDKIDTHVIDTNGTNLIDRFVTDMATNPYWFSLVHLRAPDDAGHSAGWMSEAYLDSVRAVDSSLGTILEFVEGDPELDGKTVIIVVSDHGGDGTGHGTATVAVNYTVPFYVWGAEVGPGDLYELNPSTRLDPGTGRPGDAAAPPPIRNGDAANLALDFLGLPPVPGSTINPGQDLAVTVSEPAVRTAISVTNPASGRWSLLVIPDGAADSFYFGRPGDLPIVGDWDCDGFVTPGVYRRASGKVYLTNSIGTVPGELVFFFGGPGDLPVVGDWNGDGCDTLAVYRTGRAFISNSLDTRPADFSFLFGAPGDSPFAGDFDGNGGDSLGVYRATTGMVYLRNLLTSGPGQVEFPYGEPFDQILAADWDGDGDDTVGSYRPSEGRFYLSNENGDPDMIFDLGARHWMAAAGSSTG